MFDRVILREVIGDNNRIAVIEKYEVSDALTSWFPEAPVQITEWIGHLADAINVGNRFDDLATALGITVEIVDWRTPNRAELAEWLTLRGVTADRLDAEVGEYLGKTSDELDDMYAELHND